MFRIPPCVLVGLACAVLAVPGVAAAQRGDDPPAAKPPDKPSEKLIYADFEGVDGGKALSSRGGPITVTSYQESDLHKTTTKGGTNAGNTPELVRIKPDDPNHLGKIRVRLHGPEQLGRRHASRSRARPTPTASRRRTTSPATRRSPSSSTPRAPRWCASRPSAAATAWTCRPAGRRRSFKVRPGLNTYEVPLKSLASPDWVEVKPDTKKLLAKLTALNISVICEPCRPAQGMLIVDNVTFEK